MKATITFNLSDPDDSRDYYITNKSNDMAMFIWELTHNVKKELKYDIESREDVDGYETLDMVFEKIHDLLNDYDINTDKLG